jgi:hypothetical protein
MYKDNLTGLRFLVFIVIFSILTNRNGRLIDLHLHGGICYDSTEYLNNWSIPLFIFTIINIIDIINSTKGSFQLSLLDGVKIACHTKLHW